MSGSAAFLAGLAAFGLAGVPNPVHAGEPLDPYAVLDQLGHAVKLVEDEYVEPVDRARLYEGALRGMLAELDPHSTYFSKEELDVFVGDTSGNFGGIGVEIDFVDGEVVVIAPIEGSPADRAGIEPGDVLLAIDGELISGKKPGELVQRMRGTVGTKMVLTVRSAKTTKLIDVPLVRERIEVASVVSTLLPGGVGYVRIKSFQRGTRRELLEAIAALREASAVASVGAGSKGTLDGLILDLRNNPGGLVSEASGVADEFLTAGVIYTAENRSGVVSRADARRGGAFSRGSVVVLVNEYSASAAELVAGALRDHHRAKVVGARTFGKGSVQTVALLPHDGALKLTTALYYTPSGQTLQASGVVPDVVVDPGYVDGSRVAVLRERDLEKHLTPRRGTEEVEASSIARDPAEPAGRRTPPTNAELHLGVQRHVAGDPTGGPDKALAVAYEMLTGPRSTPPEP